MSRSYKHTPYGGEKKHNKDTANRKVRRKLKNPEFGLANGKAYRKIFEPGDICDYCGIKTGQQYLNNYFLMEDGLYHWIGWYGPDKSKGYTYKELYGEWYKSYKRK